MDEVSRPDTPTRVTIGQLRLRIPGGADATTLATEVAAALQQRLTGVAGPGEVESVAARLELSPGVTPSAASIAGAVATALDEQQGAN